MSDETIEFEAGSTNGYADLGYPNAEERLRKAPLTTEIGKIIKARRWSQQPAAEVIGMLQPRLSDLLRGQFRGISETKMLDGLARLGRDIPITVGPPAAGPPPAASKGSFAELTARALRWRTLALGHRTELSDSPTRTSNRASGSESQPSGHRPLALPGATPRSGARPSRRTRRVPHRKYPPPGQPHRPLAGGAGGFGAVSARCANTPRS